MFIKAKIVYLEIILLTLDGLKNVTDTGISVLVVLAFAVAVELTLLDTLLRNDCVWPVWCIWIGSAACSNKGLNIGPIGLWIWLFCNNVFL